MAEALAGEVATPWAAGPSLPRAGLVVAPAMAVSNGLNYAFNLVMVRLLEPGAYGALGALLAVVLIGTVPGLAVQAVVARHTAVRGGDRAAVAELWSRTLAAVSWVSLGLGLVVAAAAPALAAFLHLGSLAPALWLAASILPLPLVSALQGMLQGVQRFGALGAALLVNAVARLAVGVGLVAAGHGVDGALAGSVAGSAVAVLVLLAAVRPAPALGLASASAPRPAPAPASALGREVGAASLAFLGLLLLTNVDLLLARHYLPARASGLYAAGSVVTKIAYWAPQFVATIVFPRLATARAGRQRLLGRAAMVVAGLGLGLVVVVAAAPGLAVALPFGAAYRGVGPALPLFAALGTALALAQLLLFSGIAAGDRHGHRLLGAAVAVEVAAIALGLHHSVTEVVVAALGAVAALLAAGWALERRRAGTSR